MSPTEKNLRSLLARSNDCKQAIDKNIVSVCEFQLCSYLYNVAGAFICIGEIDFHSFRQLLVAYSETYYNRNEWKFITSKTTYSDI